MKNLLIILSIVFGFTSCGNVVFEESQPQGAKLRTKIPKKLQGLYKDLDDEKSRMRIEEKLVISYSIDDENDLDTAFYISDSSMISKGGKFFYLNFKSKDKWIVIPVQLEGKYLTYWMKTEMNSDFKNKGYVKLEKEFDKSDSTYTEVYYAKPSKKELKEFHSKGIFQKPMKFIKIE